MNRVFKLTAVLLILTGACAQAPAKRAASEPEWIPATKEFLFTDRSLPHSFEEIWALLPIQSIHLVRSRPKGDVEGFYPEYEITISCASQESKESLGSYDNGPIIYIGKSDVKMIGEFHSALTIGDFARLSLLAEEYKIYGDMKDYPKTTIVENPHILLEIRMKDGKTHRLSEWGWQSPAGVWAFCCTIDKIWADRLNEARVGGMF